MIQFDPPTWKLSGTATLGAHWRSTANQNYKGGSQLFSTEFGLTRHRQIDDGTTKTIGLHVVGSYLNKGSAQTSDAYTGLKTSMGTQNSDGEGIIMSLGAGYYLNSKAVEVRTGLDYIFANMPLSVGVELGVEANKHLGLNSILGVRYYF